MREPDPIEGVSQVERDHILLSSQTSRSAFMHVSLQQEVIGGWLSNTADRSTRMRTRKREAVREEWSAFEIQQVRVLA